MNRKDALKRKRDKAIKQLRELGMTDAEIAKELGVDSLEPEQEPEIIDAEIVEVDDLSTPEPIGEPASRLPAVIPQPAAKDSAGHKPRDWSKSSVPERRCKAHKKDGSQCKNAAILGGTVCRYHGGASKFVKQAARARLDNASDLMAKQLLRMAVDDNVADAVKLTAIRDALDRAGLKAPNEVVVSAGAQTGFDDVFDGIYSGPRSDYVDTQRDSIGIDEHQPPPASVDYPPEPPSRDYGDTDCTGPADPQSYEPPPRRPSQRPRRQNRYDGFSDVDAIRLANEENARNAADPPPPRPMRALPPGQGW